MIGRGLLSGCVMTVLLFFNACGQKNGNGNNDSVSKLSESSVSHDTLPSVDLETMGRVSQMPEHRYLNTIDWEVRQPLDLSTTTIRTTANSTAERVCFTYHCNDEEIKSTAIPLNGKVSDTLDWDCNTIMTTKMVAVGSDTTIEYFYTIDIALLNSLEQ